jgi:hypothetical protein
MKKIILGLALCATMGFALDAKAQLIDESNVTITMDLQPILQLNMNGPQSIDFVFDQISEYIAGITQYAATTLTVSSTVNWDLYAVGFGSNSLGTIWDQQAIYGTGSDPNAIDSISCNALELHQNRVNPSTANAAGGIAVDYSAAFTMATALGANSVYTSATPYVRPAATEKYIAGHFNTADFVVGGTYLTAGAVGSDFYYTIDYRIKPGLPAIFPNSADNIIGSLWNGLTNGSQATNFAQPGLYTMNLKYVLTENN